jgi:hypothetical protein
MASPQLPPDEDRQYEQLLAALAELRERGRRILEEARDARDVSHDLRRSLADDRRSERLRPTR